MTSTTERRFTAGPWAVQRSPEAIEIIAADDGSFDDPWYVAKMTDFAIPAVTEANARLIAQAPALVEALQKARAHIQEEIGISGARKDYSDTDLIAEIDTVLSRALGRE